MGRVNESLRRIEAKIDLLLRATVKEKEMFDEVIAAIEEQTNTVNATVTLIEALAAKVAELAAAGTVTPEQVTALANAIKGNTQKLADAVGRVQAAA